jgi:hypothetical protein
LANNRGYLKKFQISFDKRMAICNAFRYGNFCHPYYGGEGNFQALAPYVGKKIEIKEGIQVRSVGGGRTPTPYFSPGIKGLKRNWQPVGFPLFLSPEQKLTG